MTGLLYDSLIADVSCQVALVLSFLFVTSKRRGCLAPLGARVEPPSHTKLPPPEVPGPRASCLYVPASVPKDFHICSWAKNTFPKGVIGTR